MAAFLFRVAAQAIQAWRPVAWLPPFEDWHSATLPYSLLLASQLVILAAQLWVLVALLRGTHRPRRWLGIALLVLGAALFRIHAVPAGRRAHVPAGTCRGFT